MKWSLRSRLHPKNNYHLRQNIWQLVRYLCVLVVIMVLYAAIFQWLMVNVEGEKHTWVTAFYWTMMVMSTLGFGDVAFQSDVGRFFTMIVLTTGIVQLMILLPVVFIRFGPWLESIMQIQPPKRVPQGVKDHVIITAYDEVITPELLRRLQAEQIPVFVIQQDADVASQQYVEGIPIIRGDAESIDTFEALRVQHARLVVANRQDTVNTNSILTIRELDTEVPVVAIANREQSVDVLELSGASHVLPLKRWLGEQLASRVNALYARLHHIGQYENLQIVELPVHRTPLVGKAIRETRLRERLGINVVGVWHGRKLDVVSANFVIEPHHVLVLAGTEDKLEKIEELLEIYDHNSNPVLVIGGGRVGIAAARRLKEKDIPVQIIERNSELRVQLKMLCDRVFIGDAADYDVLHEAGIMNAPSVIITTNDDAMNIYLASYCRHLNREIRIVSRITHERNVEAIHRAGADLVLRYSTLGIEAILALLEQRELMLLGEDIQFYKIPTPPALAERTLAGSEIGSRTGMVVLAIKKNESLTTTLSPHTILPEGSTLFILGNERQRRSFNQLFSS